MPRSAPRSASHVMALLAFGSRACRATVLYQLRLPAAAAAADAALCNSPGKPMPRLWHWLCELWLKQRAMHFLKRI